MIHLKEYIKNSFDRKRVFYLLVSILWIKSYLIQRFVYDLSITTLKQELILLISPLSSALLFLGLAVIFSRKKTRAMLVVSLFFTLIMYGNVLYYRFFTDFVTIPVLFQTSNMGDLGGSVFGLMEPIDILLFLDTVILFILYYKKWLPEKKPLKREIGVILLAVVAVLSVNLLLAETERPELLTRTFDREILVKNLGTYNYLIYDVFLQTKTKTKKTFANEEDLADIQTYVNDKYVAPDDELYGIAKGKNVIFVALESLQTFVINNEVNGEEITPFLNQFIKESYYFDNMYHQTSQGKTSDAEFIIENSLYGLPRGAVFFTHAGNTYDATPSMLKEEGYFSAVFHANNKSFWNRDMIYPKFGYDQFNAETFYDVTKENSVGWGLKDKEFFTQSVEMMKDLQEPYYVKLLTLTNHHPFTLGEEDRTLAPYDSNSKTLNNYFPTVRYLDEALEQFMQELKDEGLYENSIIVMYGDHYGISENHNKAMAKYLQKETITDYDHIQLQRVPFIIHIPGMEGKTISTVAGQIDIKPTLLHLLGKDTEGSVMFGQDIFTKTQNPYPTVLRDGSFVTEEYIYTENVCYNRLDGTEVELSYCEEDKEIADKELGYNDALIYGDLMRFAKE